MSRFRLKSRILNIHCLILTSACSPGLGFCLPGLSPVSVRERNPEVLFRFTVLSPTETSPPARYFRQNREAAGHTEVRYSNRRIVGCGPNTGLPVLRVPIGQLGLVCTFDTEWFQVQGDSQVQAIDRQPLPFLCTGCGGSKPKDTHQDAHEQGRKNRKIGSCNPKFWGAHIKKCWKTPPSDYTPQIVIYRGHEIPNPNNAF